MPTELQTRAADFWCLLLNSSLSCNDANITIYSGGAVSYPNIGYTGSLGCPCVQVYI